MATKKIINLSGYYYYYFLIITCLFRGGPDCTFELKVRNAQAARFDAVIIYNNDSDDLGKLFTLFFVLFLFQLNTLFFH